MTTCVEGQGTTARIYGDYSGLSADHNAKYTRDTNGSAIRKFNDYGLQTNQFVCEEPYCLDVGSWQPAKIALEEDFANQIAAEVAKKLSEQIDPLEKNADVDEVEIPPMSGFVEI